MIIHKVFCCKYAKECDFYNCNEVRLTRKAMFSTILTKWYACDCAQFKEDIDSYGYVNLYIKRGIKWKKIQTYKL